MSKFFLVATLLSIIWVSCAVLVNNLSSKSQAFPCPELETEDNPNPKCEVA